MPYLPSTAPLPSNTLTPVPQSWVDERNMKLLRLDLAAKRAKAITSCYAPISSFLESSGPIVAAEVAQAQYNLSDPGTQTGAGNSPSSGAAPQVVPLNDFSISTPGAPSFTARPVCNQPPQAPPPPPVMMMPQPAPVMAPANPSPVPADVMAAPHWNNLCWALRNGSVLQSQFAPGDYLAIDWACSQKGYTGACPPPVDVEMYLQQGNLPMIPVSQAIIDSIPQAPDMTNVNCEQSRVMGGLSGLLPAWGSYNANSGWSGSPAFDLLGAICSHPIGAMLLSAAVGWGITQMTKGRR